MLDHIGFPVADFARSKAFYTQALAPLGYRLVMEVNLSDDGEDGYAGFGLERAQFWIGTGSRCNRGCTWRSWPKIAARCALFTRQRLPPAVSITARRACDRIIMRIITVPLCWIPTVTTSRR